MVNGALPFSTQINHSAHCGSDRRHPQAAQLRPKFLRFWTAIARYGSAVPAEKAYPVRERTPMPMNDSFDPVDPLPRFLAGQTEQQGIADVRDRGVTISRVILSILVAVVTATGVAALALGSPAALFTEVTASLTSNPPPQPSTAPSPPAIQAADNAPALAQFNTDAKADAETLPPTANDAPASSEVAAAEPAASEPAAKDPVGMEPAAQDPAAKDPAETIAPSSDALFRRFQTWLSDQDAQAKVEPAQPSQDASLAKVESKAPAQDDENAWARASRRLSRMH